MSDLLFDVPSVPAPLKPWQKLKAKFGILTHEDAHSFDRWIAILPFPEDQGKQFMECIEESRWLDYGDAGHTFAAPTEEEAILNLCQQMRLPITLKELML